MRTLTAGFALTLAGCATYLDPNYAIQIQAYNDTVRAQQMVEVAKAQSETARFEAMQSIAQSGDAGTRTMALLALALARGGGADARVINVSPPAAPERQEDRAFKWAALFAAPVATLAQGYFGYRLGVAQTNTQRDTSIASYNAISGVAGSGFGAVSNVAGAGFAALPLLAGQIRPPQANVTTNMTIGRDGVIAGRDGSFVGPNSGANSGNTGHIGNQDRNASPDNPPPVTVPPGP